MKKIYMIFFSKLVCLCLNPGIEPKPPTCQAKLIWLCVVKSKYEEKKMKIEIFYLAIAGNRTRAAGVVLLSANHFTIPPCSNGGRSRVFIQKWRENY